MTLTAEVAATGQSLSGPLRLFIGGEWVEAASGRTFDSIDPYTGEVWAQVPEASAADVDRAVAAARTAFDEGPWPRLPGVERARIMRRLARRIEEHADELAVVEVRDNGKLLREMSGQAALLPEFYDYFAGAADKIGGQVLDSSKSNFFVYQLPEPVGVVGAITPWNSPLLLTAFKLAPALAAGCTFVLKPSEHTSVSALRFAEITAEAGVPDGVFNVVTGDGPAHPGVDKVSFTGSVATGIRVSKAAAEHLAPVTLELGGKSPNIVFADADLEAAANGVVAGIFAACGQTCIAGSRLLVERVERVAGRAREIILGNPMDPATEMGPLAYAAHWDKVMGYIEIGTAEGAELATGGRRPERFGDGLFVEPTVFCGVDNTMRIAREEIFGPVLSVIPFEGEAEALASANDSPFGLAAGVWTRDVQRVHRMVPRLQAGTIWVNAYRTLNYDVPFGGYKMSGHGRENGLDGLREYLHTKSVWIEMSGATRDPFKLG
ncbi:MAG: aldehyde dehydrogenase [Acidimicrobiia bacterium]|nr:aldehyde dehydrogenase [Acidimicrobiia bacterium]